MRSKLTRIIILVVIIITVTTVMGVFYFLPNDIQAQQFLDSYNEEYIDIYSNSMTQNTLITETGNIFSPQQLIDNADRGVKVMSDFISNKNENKTKLLSYKKSLISQREKKLIGNAILNLDTEVKTSKEYKAKFLVFLIAEKSKELGSNPSDSAYLEYFTVSASYINQLSELTGNMLPLSTKYYSTWRESYYLKTKAPNSLTPEESSNFDKVIEEASSMNNDSYINSVSKELEDLSFSYQAS